MTFTDSLLSLTAPESFIRIHQDIWIFSDTPGDSTEPGLHSIEPGLLAEEQVEPLSIRTSSAPPPSTTASAADFDGHVVISLEAEPEPSHGVTLFSGYAYDGTQNNFSHPAWGAVQTPLISIAPLAYADGASTPAGGNRPNPRVISNALAQQDVSIPDPRGLTNVIWAWGQFLDHDLDLTPELSYQEAARQDRFISIPVPSGDPYLDPFGTGEVSIELRDTVRMEGTGTDPSNPSQLPNVVTSWMDGSQVYGSSQERALALRSFTAGELLISEGNLLPLNTAGLENDNPTERPPEQLFVAGDVRANENVVLTSLHTLFVREHNRLARQLALAEPTWSDEQLYQAARQINAAQIQSITYNDYLPTLLGVAALPTYGGYDPSVNPGISRTFSTAAFRLGHTQLSSEIFRIDPDGALIPEGNLSLAESFFPGSGALQQAGIDPILRGLAASASQRVDTETIGDVRNLLFGFGPAASARDLFAINIQRGRVNGIADYNTIREAFGLSRVQSFAEITSDPSKRAALTTLYESVDSIDAFVGMLAEDLLPGASVGETISAVLVDQFTRLRAADRYYFENVLSADDLERVQSTQLSDIILRNTDTKNIQANVFHSGDIDLDLHISFLPPRTLLNLNELLDKPQALTFSYTGGAVLRTAQDADKALTWGVPDDDPLAYIVVTDEDDPTKLLQGKGDTYFAGTMAWGQPFTASAIAADQDRFASTTHLMVYEDELSYRRGEDPLQQSVFDTSGSQPINLGDAWGAVTLMGYRGKRGEMSLPAPLAGHGAGPLTVEASTPLSVTVQVSNPGQLALRDIALQSHSGDAPHWLGGDTNANDLLDPGEVWTYRAMETAQLGLNQISMDLRAVASTPHGKALGLPDLTDSEAIDYQGIPPVPAGDLTRVLGDPRALTFRYLAGSQILTAGEDNDQDGKAAIVRGAPDDDSSAYIVVSKSKDVEKIKAGEKPLYFAGTVEAGQSFTADLAFTNQSEFGNDTYVLIFEDETTFLAGGAPLQVVAYHTGGSEPMGIGDLIGAVQLEGYEGTDGVYQAPGIDVLTGSVGAGFSLVGLFGKPEALTFRYDAGTDLLTGGKGGNQDGKAQRLGLRRPDADGTSFIRVSDRERPDDLSGQEFFEGMVTQDTTFTASHSAPGVTKPVGSQKSSTSTTSKASGAPIWVRCPMAPMAPSPSTSATGSPAAPWWASRVRTVQRCSSDAFWWQALLRCPVSTT